METLVVMVGVAIVVAITVTMGFGWGSRLGPSPLVVTQLLIPSLTESDPNLHPKSNVS